MVVIKETDTARVHTNKYSTLLINKQLTFHSMPKTFTQQKTYTLYAFKKRVLDSPFIKIAVINLQM